MPAGISRKRAAQGLDPLGSEQESRAARRTHASTIMVMALETIAASSSCRRGVGRGWTENWTDIWAAQRGQLASARIRPPPEHLRTAAAVRGTAASRSFEKVRTWLGGEAELAGWRRWRR
ncbi:hypothetical protein GUJ93_ZPchr0001g32538 [Zizania palustris]|uniref:Uncharacterized protein n=1 Tax=Zizania palustris TaxID=103762 RepID=A0A8J5SFC7_ZIZPA|nr:hypothetical protein GUJ93_ZPchr0001g32538 [Zizania palustris]